MAHFFHIGVNCYARAVPYDKIQPHIDQAKDWVRYSNNSWFIWTNESAEFWYRRLRPQLHPDDSIIVVEVIVTNAFGWMQQMAVDWLTRDRTIDRPGL